MATDYQVTGVRTAPPYVGYHDHITAVRVSTGSIWPVQTVIDDLRAVYGDRYYTFAGGQYADVILRSCPVCGHPDYITTTPDSTTDNNLLSLPRV